MGKKSNWVQISLFLAFSICFLPKHGSARQIIFRTGKPVFTAVPAFSFQSLFSGRFTSEFETLYDGSVCFRDSWTTLKARSELAAGKRRTTAYTIAENPLREGITLNPGFLAPIRAVWTKNSAHWKASTDTRTYSFILPLFPTLRKYGRINCRSTSVGSENPSSITFLYAQRRKDSGYVSALSAHEEEPVFYRTDITGPRSAPITVYCSYGSHAFRRSSQTLSGQEGFRQLPRHRLLILGFSW
jgi:hypothetical protein